MRKLKAVKASFLLAIMLFGICVAFTTAPASAQGLGLFQGNIDLTYDPSDIPNTIRPETDTVRVKLYINYFVSGTGSKFVIPFFGQNTAPIELSIGDTPDWLTVSVSPGVVYPLLAIQKADTPEQVIVTINLMPNAPAFQAENIEVIAEHKNIIPVSASKNKITIPIKSGFYSNYQYEFESFQQVGAGETTTFPITITGYANARSRITFEVLDPEEGWSTSINSEFFLGTTALGEDATGTVNFQIQSPLDFGYHNEVKQFNVKVLTMAAGHPEIPADNTTTLQFTVRSRGFSTPGFEMTITIFALMAMIVIYRKKRRS